MAKVGPAPHAPHGTSPKAPRGVPLHDDVRVGQGPREAWPARVRVVLVDRGEDRGRAAGAPVDARLEMVVELAAVGQFGGSASREGEASPRKGLHPGRVVSHDRRDRPSADDSAVAVEFGDRDWGSVGLDDWLNLNGEGRNIATCGDRRRCNDENEAGPLPMHSPFVPRGGRPSHLESLIRIASSGEVSASASHWIQSLGRSPQRRPRDGTCRACGPIRPPDPRYNVRSAEPECPISRTSLSGTS